MGASGLGTKSNEAIARCSKVAGWIPGDVVQKNAEETVTMGIKESIIYIRPYPYGEESERPSVGYNCGSRQVSTSKGHCGCSSEPSVRKCRTTLLISSATPVHT